MGRRKVRKLKECDVNENIESVDKTSDQIENDPGSSTPISVSLTLHSTTGTSTAEDMKSKEPREDFCDEFKKEEKDINSNEENKEVFVAKLMSHEEKEAFFAKLTADFKKK